MLLEAATLASSGLLEAMIMVESGGDDSAVGDGGKAIGCLQIHEVMVRDVNRIARTRYVWPADCYSRQKSGEIWELYVNHYCKGVSDEVIARRWNGGPRGELKASTRRYWDKVKSFLGGAINGR